jgi:hypothetical protein
MKKSQNTKLSMELSVQKACNDNRPLWTGFTAFENTFNDFESLLEKTNTVLGKQGINIKGVTNDKKAEKQSLRNIMLEVAGAVHAYATDTGDLELKGKVDIKPSTLDRMRGTEFDAICLAVYNEALQVSDQLPDYGVDKDVMTSFKNSLDSFSRLLPAPRTAIVERKGATDELAKLLKKIDCLLNDKLDKLMKKFQVSNPDFYRLYFDARINVDSGSRHLPPADNNTIAPAS